LGPPNVFPNALESLVSLVSHRASFVVALLAAGCVIDRPATAPDLAGSPLGGPSFSAVAATDAAPNYIVISSGATLPKDYAARVAAFGGKIAAQYDAIGVAVVEGLTPDAAAALRSGPGIGIVEPDVEHVLLDPIGDVQLEAVEDAVEAHQSPTLGTRYARQWNMRAIQADAAWAAGRRGSPSVKVAILDTGIDYTYPELVGLVDLTLSTSFVPSDLPFIPAGAHPIADLHFHGTHVASTVVSNAHIFAGVTQRVTLIGVKVLSRTGSGSTSGVLAGIMYAADAGADVINMSLGSTFRKDSFPGFVSVINRAMTYANRQGTLVVVSAGNEADDLDHNGSHYKAYCDAPNVVCVSATGPTAAVSVDGPWTNVDALAGYSNFGRSAISVGAPGGNSGGAVWAACSRFTRMASLAVCRTGIFILGSNGTSMASPHVAGVAALIVEDVGADRPSQVKARLEQSADDLGQPGTDPAYGKGRINVARAVGAQ
jgi:subtilisin family serine protease